MGISSKDLDIPLYIELRDIAMNNGCVTKEGYVSGQFITWFKKAKRSGLTDVEIRENFNQSRFGTEFLWNNWLPMRLVDWYKNITVGMSNKKRSSVKKVVESLISENNSITSDEIESHSEFQSAITIRRKIYEFSSPEKRELFLELTKGISTRTKRTAIANTIQDASTIELARQEAEKIVAAPRRPQKRYKEISQEHIELKAELSAIASGVNKKSYFGTFWCNNRQKPVDIIKQEFYRLGLDKEAPPKQKLSENKISLRKKLAQKAKANGWTHQKHNGVSDHFNAWWKQHKDKTVREIIQWFEKSRFNKTNPRIYDNLDVLMEVFEPVIAQVNVVLTPFKNLITEKKQNEGMLKQIREGILPLITDEIAVDAFLKNVVLKAA